MAIVFIIGPPHPGSFDATKSAHARDEETDGRGTLCRQRFADFNR